MSDFAEFPKIARLRRNCVVSEKLDGTNAHVFVLDPSMPCEIPGMFDSVPWVREVEGLKLAAGSRNRYVTATDDNYGFAKWVIGNAEELAKLGVGRHYGEFWGAGIQRGYGLKEKRFSLFNASRWSDPLTRPACCGVVPVLANGIFTTELVEGAVARLRAEGSVAAPGFMRPEGVVVFHVAANTRFKVMLEKDESPKGQQ